MLGLRKLLRLLGRSKQPEYDCERAQLSPVCSSPSIIGFTQGWSSIIFGLFSGLTTLPQKPLICAEQILHGASHDNVGLLSAVPDEDAHEHTSFRLSTITSVEIKPIVVQPTPLAHVASQELGIVTPLIPEENDALSTALQPQDNADERCAGVDNGTHTPVNGTGFNDSRTIVDSGTAKDSSQIEVVTTVTVTRHAEQHAFPCATSDHGANRVRDQQVHDETLIDENPTVASSDAPPVSSDDDDDDGWDDMVDKDVLRADWEPLRAIPEGRFRETLLEHLPMGHKFDLDDIQCVDEIRGGNSLVRILEIDVHDDPNIYGGCWIIKVPCTGTAQRWQESDAYMLRNDARTMDYIRKNTSLPCPEVLAFSDALDNVLGAPFIIMRANEGVPANKIWFDRDEDSDDDDDDTESHNEDADGDDVVLAYLAGQERIDIRVNFLRSLAHTMAKLQTLEFDRAGTLNFDDTLDVPSIGPTYHWKTVSDLVRLKKEDMSTPASINCVPSFATGREYFQTALDEKWPHKEGINRGIYNARRNVMCTILDSAPFNKSVKAGDTKETFVLRHDDLDFQNILCNPETGEVTGIIDWDKCRAAPRCIGFASLPAFLTPDWAPDYATWGQPHMPWELDEYRNVYAQAMLEATGSEGDGKYTIKSAIYEAVNAALYGGHSGGSVANFVYLVLQELKSTRKFQYKDILARLSDGDWLHGKWMVDHDIASLVAPQSEIESVIPPLHPESD